MKFLRVAALVMASVIALSVLVGIFLPRQWNVEVTMTTQATPQQLMPLVRDFREWSRWTTPMPETTYSYSDQQGTVGSWMSWTGKKSRAKFIVTEVSDTKFAFDEQMESDTVNANGAITAEPGANGTRLSWKDTGTLPPILGGYFRGLMENALTEHMKGGLLKLSALAEASKAPAVVPTEVVAPTEAPAVDAGAVEAAPVVVDAGEPTAVAAEVDAGAAAEETADAGTSP